MISNPLSYLAEAMLCSTVLYLFYRVVLSKEKSFSFNRWYLLGSIVLSLVLPLLSFSTSAGGTGNIATYYLPEVNVATETEHAMQTTVNWWALLYYAYLAIVVLKLTILLIKTTRLRRLIKDAQVEHKDGYSLVLTGKRMPVSTFFHYIFWNPAAQLTEQDKELVLQHELAHVKQLHSADLLLLELLSCIFWINPLWPLYRRSLEETHEYLADREVLRLADARRYGSLIARYTLQEAGLDLTHSFANQSLKRITMIKNTLNTVKPLKLLLALPLAALMFWTISCEEAEQPGTSDDEVIVKENTTVKEDKVTTVEEDVVVEVDENPAPVGGFEAYSQYLLENMKYPEEAKDADVEGKVYVQFIVQKDGSIANVKAIKGIGHGCDEEAVRVVSQMPAWNPGTLNGEPQNVRMVLPVVFKLQ